jgi:hypothetical protein
MTEQERERIAEALNEFLNSAPMVNGAPWHKLTEPYRERMRMYAEQFDSLLQRINHR